MMDLASVGARFTVILDGTKVDDIWPRQLKVFSVPPGDHWLRLEYWGFLRRSPELHVSLRQDEEKQVVCFMNAIGYPTVRSATAKDVAKLERSKPAHVNPRNLAEGNSD